MTDLGDGSGGGRYCFPLYEDLTRQNHAKLIAISQDPRTQSCWSINGQICYKLVNSTVIRKVGSILDPLDIILAG
jgi:hypothetical protein